MSQAFDYRAQMEVGDKVITSVDRKFTNPVFGEVFNVGSAGCDIRCVTADTMFVLFSCWHEDDPRMRELGKFEAALARRKNDLTGVVSTGVFRLTESQKAQKQVASQLRAMESRLVASDTALERLVRRVAALESDVKMLLSPSSQAEQEVNKPRRGRPPKQIRSAAELAAYEMITQ